VPLVHGMPHAVHGAVQGRLLELLGEPHEPRQQLSQHVVFERRHLVGGRGGC
jgi:hypothetical protein